MVRGLEFSQYLNGQDETIKFAGRIGRQLKGGEMIELIGDLGTGKTTFVRGLVSGAGSSDHVSSPSFTIRNDYRVNDLLIAHFDFYRLDDPGIVKDMLAEELDDSATTVVAEWATAVDDILPIDRIRILFKVATNDGRWIKIDYPERFYYLFKGLGNQ